MLRIGIDVGWSTKRPSCGVAVRGARKLTLPRGGFEYLPAQPEGVRAWAEKLSGLLARIERWRAEAPDELEDAIVVLDGPFARSGRPTTRRNVDTWFRAPPCRPFFQPMEVTHPSSAPFLEATYAVLSALGASDENVWVGGALPDGLVVAETNPTVILCTLVDEQMPASLPSRRYAQLLGTRMVRAKSDWYWSIGAAARVAAMFGHRDTEKYEAEIHHERTAALACLAMAQQMADGVAAPAGDPDAVYVFPERVSESWVGVLNRIQPGRKSVGASYPARALPETTGWRATPNVTEFDPDEGEETWLKGDAVELVLCDSGGVNERQNPWLSELVPPVRLRVAGRALEICLEHGPGRARNKDQWVADPSTLGFRSKLVAVGGCPDGHDPQAQLELDNALVVRVEIVSTG